MILHQERLVEKLKKDFEDELKDRKLTTPMSCKTHVAKAKESDRIDADMSEYRDLNDYGQYKTLIVVCSFFHD